MKTLLVLFFSISILLVVSCGNDETGNTVIKKDKISGFIQKGPYLNGTSILISELDANLNPTGKVFNTQITDNKGSFEITNLELNSKYVELIANGYYFNEITGKVSLSQLTLHAISDLSDSSTVNVNILTELEKNRVKYLVSDGRSFKDAKIQAQKELLKIFEIEKNDIKPSEYLDISRSGDDNTILLAVSVIMQGLRNEAELSELIADISSDMKEDGVLNNTILGQKLINDISRINQADIRTNIESRYSQLGVQLAVPDFEKYVKQFTDNTPFTTTSGIEYADNGTFGSNILSLNKIDYSDIVNSKCSLTAKLARGTSLKVLFYPDMIRDTTVTVIVTDSSTNVISDPGHYSSYSVALPQNSGWGVNNDSYPIDGSMILYNIESDRTIETQFYLTNHGSAKLEIYENNLIIPKRIKQIKW